MKLHLSRPEGSNQITGYGPGFVAVNGVRYASSLIVTADRLDPDWGVADVAALAAVHIERLAAFSPEVVLLGTGDRSRFPHPAVLRPLIDARIGYEIMPTGAACRTFGVLAAEGRKVLAALMVA